MRRAAPKAHWPACPCLPDTRMPHPIAQTDFRAALLDAAQPVPDGLLDGHGRPAGRRFDVYRNNVATSLIEALEASFPAVAKLLGTPNFQSIAGLYLRQHPPTSPLMMYYGAGFPDFVEGFEPLQRYPYLADVARLEHAQRESYHAADAAPADAGILATLSPGALCGARLTLAPAVRLVSSRWPVHAIWAYNMVEAAPKPAGTAQDVLITRPEFDPVLTPVSPGTARLIAGLSAGAPLADANEAAITAEPDFDLSTALGLLLSGNAITHIKPGDEHP